ncbi:thermonuclease family protein [Sphingobacterium sp. E70]|uniref:thermonuclease family protein n=1 Tax=Sphingobacterium sp. E70 TaxID=2853439 RepID=UPI00211C55C7|nr:thermonuclease family protein [Sphingobacterium sp. E70]
MKVRRVIDGDTFVIENGSKKGERVRLIGIDAPETRRTARKEVGYYGVEAKEYLKALLTGKNVKLVFDVGKRIVMEDFSLMCILGRNLLTRS